MIWQLILFLFFGALLLFAGVMIGGWLVFKSKSKPGETMFRVPKGEAFTVAGAEDLPETPPNEAEQHVAKKAEDFLKRLVGG